MEKYTDDEIRAMPKITIKIAADYSTLCRYFFAFLPFR